MLTGCFRTRVRRRRVSRATARATAAAGDDHVVPRHECANGVVRAGAVEMAGVGSAAPSWCLPALGWARAAGLGRRRSGGVEERERAAIEMEARRRIGAGDRDGRMAGRAADVGAVGRWAVGVGWPHRKLLCSVLQCPVRRLGDGCFELTSQVSGSWVFLRGAQVAGPSGSGSGVGQSGRECRQRPTVDSGSRREAQARTVWTTVPL